MIQHSEIDILLIRRWFTDRSSIGEFFFDGQPRECFILEDVARANDVKIPKLTCIPAIDYFIKLTFSDRFGRIMPIIYNEEYYKDPTGKEYWDLIRINNIIFTGVRIHIGNFDGNTDACQLPGTSKGENAVWNSEKAFNPLFDKIDNKIRLLNRPLRYRIVHQQEA